MIFNNIIKEFVSLKIQGKFMVTNNNLGEKTCNSRFDELSRKWALVLIKNMFLGCKKFNDFLEANTNLTNKVLSDQLKRLVVCGFISKNVISVTPLRAEYELTEMGEDLNKILYEKMVFGIKYGFVDKDCPHFKNKSLEEIFKIKKQIDPIKS